MEDKVKNIGAAVPITFRADPDDKQKFQDFAKENRINQAEMFDALIQNYEMAQAKGRIPDRGKEIETFQDTLNKISGMFINSLEINQTSEARIRDTLSLELTTKDQTIADLQEYKKNNTVKVTELMDEIEALQGTISESEGLLLKSTDELEEKVKTVIQQREQIDTLNSLVTDYKGYRDDNKIIVGLNANLTSEKLDLDNEIKKIKNELASEQEKRDFYKAQIRENRDEYKITLQKMADSQNKKEKESIENQKQQLDETKNEYKQQITALKDEHKQELNEIKDEYKQQILTIKTDFKADMDNAISKSSK